MGLKNTEFFDNSSYESDDTQIIVCSQCLSHLCLSNLIISDKFRGSSGDAYLVDRLINVQPDDHDQETQMLTGVYVINKVRCAQCYTNIGWFYKKLANYSEAYKEGKYVVEKLYIREVQNQSSTASLLHQAKCLHRRRSSANSVSSSSIDEESCIDSFRRKRSHNFKFTPYSVSFLNLLALLFSRSRQQALPSSKDDFNEHDEDSNVFVDA